MLRKIAHRLYYKALKFLRGEDLASEFGPAKITDYMYVGKQPKSPGDYGLLLDLNIGLIINCAANCEPCLIKEDGLKEEPPIETIWIKAYDDPIMPPISLEDIIPIIEKVKRHLAAGKRIYVHCRAGRHRAVAAACCILISISHLTADGAMALVKFMRPQADPHHSPIEKVIREFELDITSQQ